MENTYFIGSAITFAVILKSTWYQSQAANVRKNRNDMEDNSYKWGKEIRNSLISFDIDGQSSS